MSESVFASLAWLQYQTSWIIGYVLRIFRYFSFDFINIIDLSLRDYLMTHDVIDNVAWLIFLLLHHFATYYHTDTKYRKNGLYIHTQDG